jgi:RecA/RadA recombinase
LKEKFLKSKTSEKNKRVDKVRKLKSVAADSFHDDDFFAEFTSEAKAVLNDGEVLVPTSVDDALLEVNGWIPMPDDVCHMMDTPGVPCGLITTVYGLPDCGKTTFANTALKSTQDEKGIAILFKTEDKYSLKRAAGMGIDVKKLMIFRPRTIEEVGDRMELIVTIIKKRGWENRKITVVWDSLAATVSKSEIDTNRKEFSMDAAKAIRGMLRRVTSLIKESNIAFIIVNQVYDNTNSFGEKTTPYGGKGPLYHSAIMLKFAQKNRIRPTGKKDGDFCGINAVVEVKKNHLGQPFKTGEFQIDWKGFVNDRSPEYAPKYVKEDVADEEELDEPITDTELSPQKKKRTKPKSESTSP